MSLHSYFLSHSYSQTFRSPLQQCLIHLSALVLPSLTVCCPVDFGSLLTFWRHFFYPTFVSPLVCLLSVSSSSEDFTCSGLFIFITFHSLALFHSCSHFLFAFIKKESSLFVNLWTCTGSLPHPLAAGKTG